MNINGENVKIQHRDCRNISKGKCLISILEIKFNIFFNLITCLCNIIRKFMTLNLANKISFSLKNFKISFWAIQKRLKLDSAWSRFWIVSPNTVYLKCYINNWNDYSKTDNKRFILQYLQQQGAKNGLRYIIICRQFLSLFFVKFTCYCSQSFSNWQQTFKWNTQDVNYHFY